jgi:hypothetical protein
MQIAALSADERDACCHQAEEGNVYSFPLEGLNVFVDNCNLPIIDVAAFLSINA